MQQGQPSRTAHEVALYRAAHQVLDVPKVFDDPLATRIMGKELDSALRNNPRRFQVNSQVRAFVVARSRYTEDQVAAAVQRGVRQYVILGAGLDTFAYRNIHAATGLRVFEVDHPATQFWKQNQLREAGIAIPESLTFASIDFEKQTVAEGLAHAGFRTNEPAFISMIGLVTYLPQATVMKLLEYAASFPEGSAIVFDYGKLTSLLTDQQRAMRESAARQAAKLGEPFATFLDPSVLEKDLKRMGFTHIDDFGPEEANARYFGNRADGLRLGSSGRRIVGAGR